MAELVGGSEVGVGDQVDRSHRSLGLAQSGQVVVRLESTTDVGGRHAEGGKAVRPQPDPHGEDAGAEDFGALDPLDRGQLRLDHPGEEVGHLIGLHLRRGEAEIHGGPEFVGVLELDNGVFRLGGELVADLRELRLDLRQGGVRIVVELQVDGDRAEALPACALDVIDPLGRRDDAFQRRGDVAADEVGVGADVGGGDLDDRDVAPRVLADVQDMDRLKPRQQDDQIDHERQHGAPDEEIGEFHGTPRAGSGRLSCPSASARDYCRVGRCC